jgi:hypothetical protein
MARGLSLSLSLSLFWKCSLSILLDSRCVYDQPNSKSTDTVGKTRSRAFQNFNRLLNQTSRGEGIAIMARGLNLSLSLSLIWKGSLSILVDSPCMYDRRNSKGKGTVGKRRSRAFQNCNRWLNLSATAKVTGSRVGRATGEMIFIKLGSQRSQAHTLIYISISIGVRSS